MTQAISSIELGSLIPKRIAEFERDENNNIVLLKPKFRNRVLAKIILPRMKQPNFRIRLDEIGSFVWERIDGKVTVADIAEEMLSKFGEKIEPISERLNLFINQLTKGGFIALYKLDVD